VDRRWIKVEHEKEDIQVYHRPFLCTFLTSRRSGFRVAGEKMPRRLDHRLDQADIDGGRDEAMHDLRPQTGSSGSGG